MQSSKHCPTFLFLSLSSLPSLTAFSHCFYYQCDQKYEIGDMKTFSKDLSKGTHSTKALHLIFEDQIYSSHHMSRTVRSPKEISRSLAKKGSWTPARKASCSDISLLDSPHLSPFAENLSKLILDLWPHKQEHYKGIIVIFRGFFKKTEVLTAG